MFRDDIKREFDKITPSDELTASIAAMMREEAVKPRRPIYMNAPKIVATAAAVCLITALSVVAVNSVKDSNNLTASAPAADEAPMLYNGASDMGILRAETADEISDGAGAVQYAETRPAESAAEKALAPSAGDTVAGYSGNSDDYMNGSAPMTSTAYAPASEPQEAYDNIADEAENDIAVEAVDEDRASAASELAYGGDGPETMYFISVTLPLDNIPGNIMDKFAGAESFNEWENDTRFSKDFSDLDGFINLYSFRKHYNVSSEDMEAALTECREQYLKYDVIPLYSEEDIKLLSYGTKEELSEHYANECTVYHNGKLYTMQWFDTHTVEDYREAGIPAERIKEKLDGMLYLRNFRNPETRENFDLAGLMTKIGEYIGEPVPVPPAEAAVYYTSAAQPAPVIDGTLSPVVENTLAPDGGSYDDVAMVITVVGDVTEGAIMLCPIEGSWELASADLFSVSKSLFDGLGDVKIGDHFQVDYDGNILETFPAQFGKIYSIKRSDGSSFIA